MTLWTIVVAGGSGHRYGAPKQFEQIGDKTVLAWSVTHARTVSDGVVVVVPAADVERSEVTACGADVVTAGGATRAESVRAGIAMVPSASDFILVHDAARPAASPELFARVVEALRAGEGRAVVPVVPVVDSLRSRDGAAVDRESFVGVQTPQGFRSEVLRVAHAHNGEASDDATLVEQAGFTVTQVQGETGNIKATTPADMPRLARTLRVRKEMRIGNGFDIHTFSDDPTRVLKLGGVTFPEARGLVGHSDGDIVAHACAEALLGAAGLGDLGSWFPDTDPNFSGADSMDLLATVVAAVTEAGWQVINIDCSVVCEEPKLAPYRTAMQENLCRIVDAPVSVKGRRAEGLGALGRREGIACWSSALLEKK